MDNQRLHILKTLSLPDRYERLRERLGDRVAELIVQPSPETLAEFRRAASSINIRGEGMLVPLSATSGSGKTTLANSLTIFFPDAYTPTEIYTGEINYNSMNEVVKQARKEFSHDDRRIIPINIDHREGYPPTTSELSTIKRFLRAPSLGSRSIVVWPETDSGIAQEISEDYISIAGESVIGLPVSVRGPDPETWQDITLHTLKLSNPVPAVDELGISPYDYVPAKFENIGSFMRRISNDFAKYLDELLRATKTPLNLVIVYVSESYDAGVLSQLSSGAEYGLLDSHALLSATPGSMIGRWWSDRRGLLTQTIYKLNAHGFCLPPAASVAILRAYGPPDIIADLKSAGVGKRPPSRIHKYISRTDIGKYLVGDDTSAYETRGKPPEDAREAIALLASNNRFVHAKDKSLNAAMLDALRVYLEKSEIPFVSLTNEKKLGFCELIPDNAIETEQEVICLEYTWRSRDFLSSAKRSAVAQYALRKLKNYAVKLGWAKP
jgi:energy-coupling factor transporter ATP-binding protein EcfA2